MKLHFFYIFTLLLFELNVSFGQEYEVKSCAFNSGYNDFGPTFYDNQILFCSDKKVHTAINWLDATGNYPSGIYLAESSTSINSDLLSPEFLNKLNTGPAFFDKKNQTLWFSRTIMSGSKRVQGLFYVTKQNSTWSELIPFVHNSDDNEFSLGYPFISEDGKYLYFASDMPSGLGGKDLYRCERQENGWSIPENLGPEINTIKNEISPYLDPTGKLYFASDLESTGIDYDIYCAFPQENKFAYKFILPSPINTPNDDFAMIVAADGESGFLTSNRNDGQDDIYSFRLMYPEFESCPPVEQPTFCYLFEETEILPNDTMPLIFEWEFGDGKKSKGLSAEHCFEEYGSYHVQLNVYDSLTRIQFARVSEVDVLIEKSPFPFITSPDSSQLDEEIRFSSIGTDLPDFTIDQIFWNLGDGKKIKGASITHAYSKPGYYTVTLGMISEPVEGKTLKTCATKVIAVGTDAELAALIDPNEDLAIRESVLQNDMRFIAQESEQAQLKYIPDSTLYYVQFKESEEQLLPESPYFQNIKYEITERFDDRDTLYKYSVGTSSEVPELLKMYNELVEAGYSASMVSEKKIDQFDRETVKRWWYIPDSLEAGMNRHLNKFNDITFDYNTFKIKEKSYDDLRYITEVLKQQPLLKLEIVAHTDSIGSEDHNLNLSLKRAQEVVNHFENNGIDKSRLISKGFGESKPIADNGTEIGRAANRRVEFIIVREVKQ